MSVKLSGVAAAMAKLHHNVDAQADTLLAKIEKASTRGDTVFKQAADKVAGIEGNLDDVNKIIDELDRATNGGPALDEPAASWAQKSAS